MGRIKKKLPLHVLDGLTYHDCQYRRIILMVDDPCDRFRTLSTKLFLTYQNVTFKEHGTNVPIVPWILAEKQSSGYDI